MVKRSKCLYCLNLWNNLIKTKREKRKEGGKERRKEGERNEGKGEEEGREGGGKEKRREGRGRDRCKDGEKIGRRKRKERRRVRADQNQINHIFWATRIPNSSQHVRDKELGQEKGRAW